MEPTEQPIDYRKLVDNYTKRYQSREIPDTIPATLYEGDLLAASGTVTVLEASVIFHPRKPELLAHVLHPPITLKVMNTKFVLNLEPSYNKTYKKESDAHCLFKIVGHNQIA
jgi:hypothetical protein